MAEKEPKRARAWAMIVYPESAPEDWKDQLDADHLAWACILHDKDKTKEGAVKKAHYHVLLLFESLKSYEQILEITQKLNAPHPQRVASLRGMVRYFVHMDNKDKYQYDKEDIEQHGGIDIDQYFQLSESQRSGCLREMSKYIIENEVDNFADFISYCISEAPSDDWFDLAMNANTFAIKTLIDSMYHKQARLDHETGADRLDLLGKVRQMMAKGVSKQEMMDTLGLSQATIYRYIKQVKEEN